MYVCMYVCMYVELPACGFDVILFVTVCVYVCLRVRKLDETEDLIAWNANSARFIINYYVMNLVSL